MEILGQISRATMADDIYYFVIIDKEPVPKKGKQRLAYNVTVFPIPLILAVDRVRHIILLSL